MLHIIGVDAEHGVILCLNRCSSNLLKEGLSSITDNIEGINWLSLLKLLLRVLLPVLVDWCSRNTFCLMLFVYALQWSLLVRWKLLFNLIWVFYFKWPIHGLHLTLIVRVDYRRHLVLNHHLLFSLDDNTLWYVQNGRIVAELAVLIQIYLEIWCNRTLVLLWMVSDPIFTLFVRGGILGW